jgi:serine/threonine protein kinase
LSGRPEPDCYPFPGTTHDELYGLIKAGKFLPLRHLSKDCQDLLSKMITVNIKKRITAREILSHPWIVKNVK